MTEKVIGEIRFIETDDGFRIEVKGDKEQMREMGDDAGTTMRVIFNFESEEEKARKASHTKTTKHKKPVKKLHHAPSHKKVHHEEEEESSDF